MTGTDSEPPDPQFHSTRWSEILAARDSPDPHTSAALAELCRTYWYPLYAYARRKGRSAEHAEDLTQGFLADSLERNFLQTVDPAKGRFRSFLLISFRNYMENQRKRDNSIKQGGRVTIVSIDGGDAEARYLREPAHVETAERLYDRRWAITVLEQALDELERTMELKNRKRLFDRIKTTLLDAEDAATYVQIAAELGMPEGTVNTAAHRMRKRLGVLIRAEIGLTVADPSEIDDEIRQLFTALSL